MDEKSRRRERFDQELERNWIAVNGAWGTVPTADTEQKINSDTVHDDSDDGQVSNDMIGSVTEEMMKDIADKISAEILQSDFISKILK